MHQCLPSLIVSLVLSRLYYGNATLSACLTTSIVILNVESGGVKLHSLVTQLSNVIKHNSDVYPHFWAMFWTMFFMTRCLAGIQDGGNNSGLVRKRLYFWLYAGLQHNIKGYLYIYAVQQHGATSLETVRRLRVKLKIAGMNRKCIQNNLYISL